MVWLRDMSDHVVVECMPAHVNRVDPQLKAQHRAYLA